MQTALSSSLKTGARVWKQEWVKNLSFTGFMSTGNREVTQQHGLVSFQLWPGICWVLTWLLSLEISSDVLRQQPAKSCGKHYTKGSECGLGATPPSMFSILCTWPTFTASSTVPDSPQVSKRCSRAVPMLQETARVQNTLLEAQPWPAPARLKLFFGTERQVFFQPM